MVAIIQGKLFNRPVVLANMYAPNWDNVDLFSNPFSLLLGLDSHDLIMGGDFNCFGSKAEQFKYKGHLT